MTYGWAILALVIIIGILVSSGILSPTYLISEECSLSSNLPCNFALVNTGGVTQLKLGIYNSFPYKIKITRVQVYSRSDSSEFTGFGKDALVESGSNANFTGTLSTALQSNTVSRFFANVSYVSCAPEVAAQGKECSVSEHTIVGRITGRVIQG